MFLFVILATLVAQGYSQMGRVIGGTYASPGFFRYQVSLQLMGQHFCGGSIISETYVITAAHCTFQFDASQIKVLVGTIDLTNQSGQYIDIDRIIQYPEYNDTTVSYDIALIKLAKSLHLGTDSVDKIEISTASISLNETEFACLSGFGRINAEGDPPHRLKFVYIPVWPRDLCIPHLITGGRTDCMVCAGEETGQEGSCKGDSGGPLALDGKLYGIVSWGFGCGAENKPSIYTYVPFFRSWIEQYVDL